MFWHTTVGLLFSLLLSAGGCGSGGDGAAPIDDANQAAADSAVDRFQPPLGPDSAKTDAVDTERIASSDAATSSLPFDGTGGGGAPGVPPESADGGNESRDEILTDASVSQGGGGAAAALDAGADGAASEMKGEDGGTVREAATPDATTGTSDGDSLTLEAGPEGGVFEFSTPGRPELGLRVEVPQGALSQPETIRVTKLGMPPEFASGGLKDSDLLAYFRLEPGGLTFLHPIRILVPVPANTHFPVGVVLFRDLKINMIDLGWGDNAGRVALTTDHFSSFTVVTQAGLGLLMANDTLRERGSLPEIRGTSSQTALQQARQLVDAKAGQFCRELEEPDFVKSFVEKAVSSVVESLSTVPEAGKFKLLEGKGDFVNSPYPKALFFSTFTGSDCSPGLNQMRIGTDEDTVSASVQQSVVTQTGPVTTAVVQPALADADAAVDAYNQQRQEIERIYEALRAFYGDLATSALASVLTGSGAALSLTPKTSFVTKFCTTSTLAGTANSDALSVETERPNGRFDLRWKLVPRKLEQKADAAIQGGSLDYCFEASIGLELDQDTSSIESYCTTKLNTDYSADATLLFSRIYSPLPFSVTAWNPDSSSPQDLTVHRGDQGTLSVRSGSPDMYYQVDTSHADSVIAKKLSLSQTLVPWSSTQDSRFDVKYEVGSVVADGIGQNGAIRLGTVILWDDRFAPFCTNFLFKTDLQVSAGVLSYQLQASSVTDPSVAGSVGLAVDGWSTSGTHGSYAISLGSSPTLSVQPKPGWTFDHWVGTADTEQNPVTFVLSGDQGVAAVVTKAPVLSWSVQLTPRTVTNCEGQSGTPYEELLVTAASSTRQAPAGSMSAAKYAQVTLSPLVDVQAVSAYHFDHWERDGANLGSSLPLQVTLTEDTAIKAVFVEDTTYAFTDYMLRTTGQVSHVCGACGMPGRACCGGNLCYQGCCVKNFDQGFGPEGWPTVCIDTGKTCPEAQGTCGADGSCGSCGGANQACCMEQRTPAIQYGFCSRSGSTCAPSPGAPDGLPGQCQACGALGQGCCYMDGWMDTAPSCTAPNVCAFVNVSTGYQCATQEHCGNAGEKCCEQTSGGSVSRSCHGSYVCTPNTDLNLHICN